MQIKTLSPEVEKKIDKFNLRKKWEKAKNLFESDIRYTSLHTELLEPQWRGIYSFRIDRKFRVLFFITQGQAEILTITNHYKK